MKNRFKNLLEGSQTSQEKSRMFAKREMIPGKKELTGRAQVHRTCAIGQQPAPAEGEPYLTLACVHLLRFRWSARASSGNGPAHFVRWTGPGKRFWEPSRGFPGPIYFMFFSFTGFLFFLFSSVSVFYLFYFFFPLLLCFFVFIFILCFKKC